MSQPGESLKDSQPGMMAEKESVIPGKKHPGPELGVFKEKENYSTRYVL